MKKRSRWHVLCEVFILLGVVLMIPLGTEHAVFGLILGGIIAGTGFVGRFLIPADKAEAWMKQNGR